MYGGVEVLCISPSPSTLSPKIGAPIRISGTPSIPPPLHSLSLPTFFQRPYYRAHYGYGSLPIALRTAIMAIAMTPLIIALSGKANIITLRIGHEKLNVIHRWVGWMSLALAIVHGCPIHCCAVA